MAAAREFLDRITSGHFGYEAADNLDGEMASLADDVEHEVVPSPSGVQTDTPGIRACYASQHICDAPLPSAKVIMKAIRVHRPGPPEVLQIEDLPVPAARPGWVRVRVRAFGLNRSELFTRQGHSPPVVFPRVPGIECVGTVDDAGGTDVQPGQTVAALMGEMGRAYDGGYAEYTLVPRDRVLPIRTSLPWDVFAALPETWLTAWGSVVEAMNMTSGHVLLVRGGTSSVGMAATSLAKSRGVHVLATTRVESKSAALRANGADDVVIDTGHIAEDVRRRMPGGVHGVLELVGTRTLLDSLQAARPGGIVCNTGMLGDVAAHRFMEDNQATGKLVVVVDT